MRLQLRDLCETFAERATWTGQIIESGYSTRLGVLEETITDVNLIEIGRRHPNHVLIKKYSRREEGSSSGADWLWSIGEPGSWISVLIQAKIVNPNTGTCRYLNYKDGSQRSTLLRYARRHRLLPLYCIYAHIPSGLDIPLQHTPAFATVPSERWACSYIAPAYVRRLCRKGQNKLTDLLPYAIPWTYLICPSSQASRTSSLARSFIKLSTIARETVADFDEESRGGGRILGKRERRERSRFSWENADAQKLLSEDIPSVAKKILSGAIPAHQSPVAGVGVISSIPVQAALGEYLALPEFDRSAYVDSITGGAESSSHDEAGARKRESR